jgi:hypothetical protein
VATAFVTAGQDIIVSEIDIAAPAERCLRNGSESWRLEMRVPEPHHGVSAVQET